MAKNDPTQVTVKGRFIGGGLFEPKVGRDYWNASIVLEEGEADKVRAAAKAALEAEFGNKVPKNLEDWTVRVGDDEDFASYDREFVNAKSKKNPPQVVVKRNGVLHEVSAEDDIVYPGCYVAASLNVYAYQGSKENNIKPGVTCSLRAVMFWKDGEKLSNRFDESEFDEFDSEIEDMELDELDDVNSIL